MNWVGTKPVAGVAVDLIGLEQVDPAVDHKRDALLEDQSLCPTRARTGVGDHLVDDDARAAHDRGSKVDHELVVLIGLVQRRSAVGSERRVHAAEAQGVDSLGSIDATRQLEWELPRAE